MEASAVFALVKDPVVALVLGWNILELARVRGHLRKLHDEREEHAERLARLEERAGIA